jgi:putative ABC transport system substrate-binding protein
MTSGVGRRGFIAAFGSAAVIWSRAARAQQAGAVPRVGFLAGGAASSSKYVDCFRTGLKDLGWVEGKNITIEYRWSDGVLEHYATLAAELVHLKPDLIVVSSTPGTQAVQQATHEIPVVFIAVSDPVASGIVASLARPGGNITGVSNFLPATSGKLLELLEAAAPGRSRAGILYNPDNAGKMLELRELQAAGKTLGIATQPLQVRSSDDIDHALRTAADLHCDSLVTLQEGVTFANRSRIIAYAQDNRLPSIYQIREFVDAGGLMSYGLNYCDHHRRGAYYADKILKGARPADLPVELPTKFELVVNLKAAAAIGLKMPATLLALADEAIE